MAKNETAAAPAPSTDKPAAAAPSGFKPKILKRVTLPTLKLGAVNYVKFLSAIQTKPKMEKDENGKPVEKTIDIAHAVNLETGEEVHFVVGDVLKKELTAAYPGDKYVGKAFMVEKKDVPGKRYKNYFIAEIEG